MSTTQNIKIQLRRGENYTGTLDVGEAFYNTSDKTLQIGDGKTALANLPKFTTTDKFPIKIFNIETSESGGIEVSVLNQIADANEDGKQIVLNFSDDTTTTSVTPLLIQANSVMGMMMLFAGQDVEVFIWQRSQTSGVVTPEQVTLATINDIPNVPIEIVQVNVVDEEFSVPVSELKSIASKVNAGKYVVVKVADQLLAPCVLDNNTISITTDSYILIYNWSSTDTGYIKPTLDQNVTAKLLSSAFIAGMLGFVPSSDQNSGIDIDATINDARIGGEAKISLADGYGDIKNPYSSKNANCVLAGPSTSGHDAPSFRALVAADIPNLAASKITSGTFDAARLPGLAASKITSGTLDKSRLPSLYGTDLYGPAEDTEDGSAYLLSNGGGGSQSQWIPVSTILDGYATTGDLSAYATQAWVTNKGYTTNKGTVTQVNIGSTSYNPTTAGVISLPAYPTVPTSLKNPNSLGIKVNSETSAFVTYDGSAAKTITIKPSTTNGAFTISDGSTTKTIQLAGKFTDTVYTLPSQYSSTVTASNVIKVNQISAPSESGGSIYGQGATGQVLKSNGDTIYWGPDNNTTYSVATASALGLVKSSTTGTTSNRDYKVQINSDGTMKVNVPWTDTNTNTTYDLRLSAYDDDTNLTTSTADPAINLFGDNVGNRIKLASSNCVSVNGNNKVVTFDLKTSGASAGSYGTSANARPEFGDSFNIPYITVDKYGRVTSISNKSVTIPSYEASEVVGRPGLMTVADRQHLDSMWNVWSADGTDDTLVNKIQEVLKVFENYPEATSLIDTFATKSDVGHKHTYSKTTSVTLSGATTTSTGAVKYLEDVSHTAATLTGTTKFNTDAIKSVALSASNTSTDGPAYVSKIAGSAPSLGGDTTFLKSITINGGNGSLSADDQETDGIKYMSDVTLTPAAATTTIAVASENHTHNVTVSGTTGNNSGTGVTSVNASYTTGRLTLTATTSAPNTHTHAYGSSTTPIATTACGSTVGAISAISGGSLNKSYKYLHHSHTAATLGTPTTGTVSIAGGEYEATTKYMKVTSTAASTGTVGISGGSVSPTIKYLTATPGNTNTSTGADN